MSHFEEWSEGKSPLLKMASLVLANGYEEIIEFFQSVKAGKQIGGYDRLPSADEWLKLYRNHRKINEGVTNAFRQINDTTAIAVDFLEQLQFSFSHLRHITNEELQEIMEELTTAERNEIANKYQGIQESITNDFNIGNEGPPKGSNAEEKERILALFRKTEMIFFMRVWAPCLFLYGDYPARLLRRARQGDDDALEKLIRLDKTVIADKRIIELFHQGKVAKKQATHDLISKSLNKKPRVTLNRRKIKYELAGLISAMSISLGQRISVPDIKGLFDAISKDAGKGSDADFEDQNEPEALTKAVNRVRPKWKTIPQPDKK
jgi:hypothetical protein